MKGNCEWIAEQFETYRIHLRAVAYRDAWLARRRERRGAGNLVTSQPRRHGRCREPWRMADDDLVAGVLRHAALAEIAARKAARRPAGTRGKRRERGESRARNTPR